MFHNILECEDKRVYVFSNASDFIISRNGKSDGQIAFIIFNAVNNLLQGAADVLHWSNNAFQADPGCN